jgi:hypothetical protein
VQGRRRKRLETQDKLLLSRQLDKSKGQKNTRPTHRVIGCNEGDSLGTRCDQRLCVCHRGEEPVFRSCRQSNGFDPQEVEVHSVFIIRPRLEAH